MYITLRLFVGLFHLAVALAITGLLKSQEFALSVLLDSGASLAMAHASEVGYLGLLKVFPEDPRSMEFSAPEAEAALDSNYVSVTRFPMPNGDGEPCQNEMRGIPGDV